MNLSIELAAKAGWFNPLATIAAPARNFLLSIVSSHRKVGCG
jgi:hypothetical protein